MKSRIIILLATVVALASAATAAAKEERTTASTRLALVKRLDHSQDVIRFFNNRGEYLRAPRKEKCWQVPWARSCRIARNVYQRHLGIAKATQLHLDRTDPIIMRLNRGLAGTPMAGLGKTLRDIGRQHNISPFFMAAAAGTESSFGHAACSGNTRNVWGLAACDGRWHVPYFNSWEEAISFYARFLASRWPSATSPYHFYGYAACDACWGRKTASWMTSRFGVSSYTKYPASSTV